MAGTVDAGYGDGVERGRKAGVLAARFSYGIEVSGRAGQKFTHP